MKVSLLVAYRNRKTHLEQLISALHSTPTKNIVELVVIEGDKHPTLHSQFCDLPNFRYHFVEMPDNFHKTRLLNVGLNNTQSQYVIPYDADLIPVNNAIENTLKIAENSKGVLPTGYRLMCESEILTGDISNMKVAHEDSETALKKHLIGTEKFGVCPIFETRKLQSIGGWQEKFVGWGAEDQDIIERYCGDDIQIGRFPSILYVHIHHGLAAGWNDEALTKRNRLLYKQKLEF